MVDSGERFTVPSSVVVFKITPTSVLVDSVKVVAGEYIGDCAVYWCAGGQEASDVSSSERAEIIFHVTKTGMCAASENGEACDGKLHVECFECVVNK